MNIVIMYNSFILAALATLLSALPSPQLMNLDAIAADPAPVLVKAPVNVVSDTPPDVAAAAIQPLTSISPSSKRDLAVEKRDGDCSPYATGSGPVPSPDTVEAFESFPTFAVHSAPSPHKDNT